MQVGPYADTPVQTAQFLHLIGDHRLYALYHLYVLRGLRRGEALGLLWSYVEFERGTLTIERQLQKRAGGVTEVCPTKTRAGQRQIALDRGTLRVLRAHRRLQATERTEAGERWTETGHIFTGKLGAPLAPDHVGHVFQGLVRTHDLPPIRLHDRRHCAASLALSAGVGLKVLQHQVGHASIMTTADTYASVLPQTAQEGAEATARLVQDAAREYSRSIRHKSTARTRPISPPAGQTKEVRLTAPATEVHNSGLACQLLGTGAVSMTAPPGFSAPRRALRCLSWLRGPALPPSLSGLPARARLSPL